MGVDLSLRARLPRKLGILPGDTAGWMNRALAAAREFAGDLAYGGSSGRDPESGHWARIELLCPGGDVAFSARNSSHVVATARTTPMGPGFHAFVCELIAHVGEATGVKWEETEDHVDEAGYYSSRDWAALDAHFAGWVTGLSRMILERRGEEEKDHSVCLPLSPQFEGGPIRTHLGPVTKDFFVPLAAHPSHASEFHLWPNRERDADLHARTATSMIWTEVAWRAPIDDAEIATLRRVLGHLAEAHRLDPARELPWREWIEIASLAGNGDVTDSVKERAARLSGGAALAGYRRHPVSYGVAGQVNLRLPGSFVERDASGATFFATDGRRTARATVFTHKKGTSDLSPPRALVDAMSASPPEDCFDESSNEGRVLGYWHRNPPPEEGHSCVAAFLRSDLVVILTASTPSTADRAWALNLWRDVEFPPKPTMHLRRS